MRSILRCWGRPSFCLDLSLTHSGSSAVMTTGVLGVGALVTIS